MTRRSQLNRQNLKWLGRMAWILVLTAAAEALIGTLVQKPFPWVAIVPAFVPVLVSLFVILPMMKAEKIATPSL